MEETNINVPIVDFGIYKDKPANVIPLNYLKWMKEKARFNLFKPEIRAYVNSILGTEGDTNANVKVEKSATLPFNKPTVRVTEANIVAECYHRLKNLGIESYLAYKLESSLFDMVIVKNNEIHIIIEFKSRTYKNMDKHRFSKQLMKYTQYNVPVLVCTHMDKIDITIKQILKILDSQELLEKPSSD